jgi:pilus assembly protein FimV
VPGSLAFATEPPAASMPERYINEMDLDFGSAAPVPAAVVNSPPPSPQNEVPPLDLVFPSNGLDFTTEPAPMPEPTAPAKVANSGMMEFDLDSLSLDLGPVTEVPSGALTIAAEDPLETKFSLAEEFRTLGDAEGAKALVEEVLAQASGPLKVKAQAFLNALS